MTDKNIIGQKIAELRKAAGMTQAELVEKLNVSYQAVSQWERSETMPDIMMMPRLAEVFSIGIGELFGEAPTVKEEVRELTEVNEEETAEKEEPVEEGADLRHYGNEVRKAVENLKNRVMTMLPSMISQRTEQNPFSECEGDITIEGDLNYNLECGGDVTVRGSILEGVVLRCDGDLTVEGDIQGAAECGGDATVEGSIFGNLTCDGDLTLLDDMYGAVNAGGDAEAEGDIYGKLNCDGDAACRGSVYGKVNTAGDLEVAGDIFGKVSCDGNVTVSGTVFGKISYDGEFRKG